MGAGRYTGSGMSSLVALLVLGFAHAAPQADKAYLIQYKPPLNKALHYDLETKITGPSGTDIKLSKTVKAIKVEGGNYTVETRFDSISFGEAPAAQTMQAERLIKSTVVTQVIDPGDRIVSSDANRGVAALMIGGVDLASALAFSPNPVKVGDMWTNTVDYNGKRLEVQLKLVGVGTEHGKQIANLSMVQQPPMEGAPPIMIKVDAATGVLERLEVSASSGKAGSMHVLIHLR